jgi:hypothetical protein
MVSEPVKTVPYVPLTNPFVERLTGAVRREFLDQALFWNSLDLKRKRDGQGGNCLSVVRTLINQARDLLGHEPDEEHEHRGDQ